jgi:sigma-B regulation protein RsbU (phosphoserine phosphatase)
MAAIYKPCFHIGGDLYDFIQLDDHTVAVAIADVIGKGIPAAMMMSMFRGTLRAYADGGHGRHSMLDIVTMLNKVACRECRNGEFITLFVAKIDTRNMEVTYCNCGHEPGLLFRGDDIIELDEGGLVLGVLEDAEYDIGTVQLKEKDCLFMYTDGLIDAVNFKGDLWGKEEMLKVAKDHLKYPSEQMIRSILRYRRRFVGLARQTDDTSIVAIRLDRESGKSE